MSHGENDLTGMEIAVIGMACRLPGARNVEEYWRNLRGGVESLTELTREELLAAGEDPAMIDAPNYVPVARMIEDIDLFDAQFFGSSPREAEVLDPQQRLILQCAWEALESAGYDSETYPGLVGVYAGCKLNLYLWNIYSNPGIIQTVGDFQAQVSNEKDYVATRISYKLGLGGPSITVQSACSTSLVAVHLGCQGLLAGESDMVLAGGVAISLPHKTGYLFREGEIYSPEGRIRAFDARAQGTIFGSGLGMVVLKRLEDALADGDTIRAVIKGSAMNNDGSVKVGYTAPGVDGQTRVIRAAQIAAQVEPDTISYIEAHGTGTPIGDPIEVKALTEAFRARTERTGFCALGSVKTNIGHLGTAAGVAALIKVVLALENGEIPPSLLFEEPNPQIDFAGSPFFVNAALRPWERNGGPRRAGVSAFGIGGTNAHVIVEEAPEVPRPAPSRPWQLLVVSAKTPTALDTATENLRRHLEEHPETPLADAAFTLQNGRRPMEQRRMVVCRDREDAVAALADPRRQVSGTPALKDPPVVFLFSGQGAQYVGMGRELYDREPLFRAEVDRCCDLLEPHLGFDLRRVLYPAPGNEEEAERRIGRTAVTQPALFVVEYAMARLWMEWGVRPEAMIGHSVGEYVAACLAGVMSLEDALALVAARGRLMDALPGGAMLGVPLPEKEVEELLGAQLSLAAVNGPGRSVVSGPEEAVEDLRERLAARGVACRRLHTSHAFHSQMMEPILAPFLALVSEVPLRAPQIPYLSNVTGRWIREEEATDPGYWVRHLRGAVRFGDGLGELLQDARRVLLEVGPGQTLVSLARQHSGRGAGRVLLTSLRHPKEEQPDQAFLLRTLGQLWIAGVGVDWKRFYEGESRRRVPLPTYPFEEKRYWIAANSLGMAQDPGLVAARRKEDLADWFWEPFWKPSAPAAPPGSGTDAGEPWLLFLDGRGLGEALAGKLRRAGRTVFTVTPGAELARTGEDCWSIDPARREDYDALFDELRAGAGLPGTIAHLWSVTGPAPDLPLELSQDLGFYSLLWLAQTLGRQNLSRPLRLGVIADGLHRVLGSEEIVPEKATVLGPAKVISQEYPMVACGSVEVVLPPPGVSLDALADDLIAELSSSLSAKPEPVVAWRKGRRWVQDYEAVRVEATLESRLGLRDRGVYLITGGLGGLGLVFAEYLARDFRARLVLVGRSALPPREEWESRMAADGDPRIAKLLELEALGAEVMTASADVGDAEAMRGLVARARERFGGPVHGVIHAAGVAGGGLMQLKTAEVAEKVLGPKVRGTRALQAALEGEPLDFLLLCSSTIAVFGGFGQVDYCAGNNFMDAFAQAAADRPGPRVLSVNWGAWDEVGMAVNTVLPRGVREAREVPPAAESVPEAPLHPLHPLLDRLVESDPERRMVFSTRFSPERHWVLDEHRIMGAGAIPGTSHLEIARAAFEQATGESRAEVRDVFFLSPIMVPEGESREVRTTLEKDGDGSYGFRVESRDEAESTGWREHARGKVGPLRGGALRQVSIAEIQERCPRVEEMDGALNGADKFVFWGPRWQSLRRVQLGDGEGLALLELPEEFVGDLDGFGLHPALLDVATALGSGLVEEGNYLPLSYKRLEVKAPIPRRVWSHLRSRGVAGGGASGETISVDVALLDEAGNAVVEIEQFTMKRVGEAKARLGKSAEKAAAKPEAKPSTAGTLGAGGIRPAEGVECLRRLLSNPLGSQVAVSTKDLKALLAQARESGRATVADQTASPAAQETMARYPRPDLKIPYAAATNEVEGRLVQVWERVLGLDQVGIDDNFFELGGDSVMGIHVATRAAEAGLQVTPEQLFQYQTVAELARAVGGTFAGSTEPGVAVAEAEPVGGAEPFALAGLAPEALERLLAGTEAEDVYPLSPLQQGLLYHSLEAPETGRYLEQMSCTLTGEIDLDAFELALQRAADRHAVLRTSFLWEDLERPLQVVHTRVRLPLFLEDWRGRSEAEQGQAFAALRIADRERGFDVTTAPLLRVTLCRVTDDSWRLLSTHHHLLLDGWSSVRVVTEVLTTFNLLISGGDPQGQMEKPRPFREYVAWLAAQNSGAAEAFWRNALAGFARPTAIGADRPAPATPPAPGDHDRRDVALPADFSALLTDLARRNQITLNNLAQAAWALLLSRVSEENDVVFGVSISSRPAVIPGIDTMVGLFLNALPLRVRLDAERPLSAWLKDLQDRQRELLEHAHTPLAEVQRWNDLPRDRPLFESFLEFWNFPLPTESTTERRQFSMSDFHYDVATNYPLSLRVVPGTELTLQLSYDRRRFETATIERMLRDLEASLRAFAELLEQDGATVGALTGRLAAADREEREARATEVSGVAREMLKQRARRRTTV
jgi:phthiocerol/phenolphthiocerol synthesis type-I polyketide synthase E